MAQVNVYLDYIREEVKKVPVLKKASDLWEEKTKVHFEYLLLGLAGILTLMLFSGFGADLICHAAAFMYPFYMTIKSLELNNNEEITFWLVYWVVYGFIGVLENFITFILYWIPFFYPMKLAFILWCYLPQFRGADVIYKNGLLPLFKKHEDSIDAAIRKVSGKKSS